MKKRVGKNNKRAQLSVFVIIALLIVAIVGTFVFLKLRGLEPVGPSASEDPQGYIKKCARNAVEQAINTITPRGGFEEPADYLMYNNEKVAWHCYTSANLQLCENKHPMLKVEIEKEIKRMVQGKIDACFGEVKKKLSKYGYKESEMNLSINIVSNEVHIILNKDISFLKNQQEIKISSFNAKINSPLYDFIVLENRIVNEEVACNCGKEVCNADLIALNKYNPNYEITRFVSGRNEDIYTIKEILSGQEFSFALRNCIR